MSQAATPASGWWWVRLSPATPRGADRRWKVYRVLDGAVQPPGSSAWYSPSAKWLRGAEWVPASPPDDPPATAITAEGTTTRREWAAGGCDDEKVRRVAAEVVDVFFDLSDSMAAYYRRHPSHKDDLAAVVTGIMLKAVR